MGDSPLFKKVVPVFKKIDKSVPLFKKADKDNNNSECKNEPKLIQTPNEQTQRTLPTQNNNQSQIPIIDNNSNYSSNITQTPQMQYSEKVNTKNV